MKYFSMFSGIGGFEYILNKKGECIGFSEIDKYASSIYKRHFPDHKNYGDATRIDPGDIPDFDLLVGGFPCQAFSVAGKRQGFMDTRGTLFFDIARILKHKRPRHIVLENVPGLLSHEGGKTFSTILGVLADIGYRVQWQVLNSKDYGVPQNRERIFIAGYLGEGRGPQIFPIGRFDSETNNNLIQVGNIDTKGHNSLWGRVYSTDGISANLNSEGGGMGAKTGLYAVPVLTPDRPEKRQNGRRFKEDGEPAFTLTGQDKHGVMIEQGIRRLTPTECERLQGFPDGWTEYGQDGGKISDSQRYKCCGNAVTTNVIERIFRNFEL